MKKLLAVFVAALLAFSMFPLAALAEDVDAVSAEPHNVTIHIVNGTIDGEQTGIVYYALDNITPQEGVPSAPSIEAADGQTITVPADKRFHISWVTRGNFEVKDVAADGVSVGVPATGIYAPGEGYSGIMDADLDVTVTYGRMEKDYTLEQTGEGMVQMQNDQGVYHTLAPGMPFTMQLGVAESFRAVPAEGWYVSEIRRGMDIISFDELEDGTAVFQMNPSPMTDRGNFKVIFAKYADVPEGYVRYMVSINGRGSLFILEEGEYHAIYDSDIYFLPAGEEAQFMAVGVSDYFLESVWNNDEFVPVDFDEDSGEMYFSFMPSDTATGNILEANFIEMLTGEDTATGIHYFLPNDQSIRPGSSLTVGTVMDGKGYETVRNAVEQLDYGNTFTIFDIALVDADGEPYQPGVWVDLWIPVPEGYDRDNLHVVHVLQDGTSEELKCELRQLTNDGWWIYTRVEHFSYFAVVNGQPKAPEATPTAPAPSAAPTTEPKTKSPKTGDTENMLLLIALAAAAGITIVAAAKKARAAK